MLAEILNPLIATMNSAHLPLLSGSVYISTFT